MSRGRSRLLLWGFLVLAVVMFAYQIRSVWVFTVDDSFITFRYAENLANGYGPNFNPNWPRAEGYTSVLWVAITTIPLLLGLDVVLCAKMGGVLLTIVTCAVVFRFVILISDSVQKSESRTPQQSTRVFGALAVLMLVSSQATSVHAVSGMETACATVLLLSFLYLVTLVADTPGRGPISLLVLVGLLLGLSRPEANLAIIVGVSCLLGLLPRGQRRRLLRLMLMLYVLPGLAYFAARWMYYGQMLPLSCYVKVCGAHTPAGLRDVALFLVYVSPLGLCAACGLRRMERRLIPGLVSCLSLLLFFLFPAHVMGYEHRFVFPMLPFFVVMAARGLAFVHARFQSSGNYGPKRATLIGVGCIGVLFVLSVRSARVHENSRSYAEGLQRAHIRLGKCLRSFAPFGSPVLAIEDAGAVPYYSKWATVDFGGLNDPEIAVSGNYDPEYVLSYHPDVVVITSYAKEKLQTRSGREFRTELYEQCLKEGMFKACTLEFRRGAYYLWVMAIPGTHIAARLERIDELPTVVERPL